MKFSRVLLLAALLFVQSGVPLPAHAADDTLSAAANAAYLSQDAKKPGTVIRPSGLQYRVLKSGFGRRPGDNDVLRLSYNLTLIDGTVVGGATPSFPTAVVRNSISLAGLAEALSLMREGDRWQLVVPPPLGLGANGGSNGAIPPHQTLLFDITLISAAPPRPGEALPGSGFSLFRDGQTSGARFTIRP